MGDEGLFQQAAFFLSQGSASYLDTIDRSRGAERFGARIGKLVDATQFSSDLGGSPVR